MSTNRLPAVLRARREQLNIGIPQIASAIGMADSSYRRIESGDVASPSPDTLQAIADVLDLPTSDLYAAAGWLPKRDLPTLRPYMRTKYNLTDEAAEQIAAEFDAIGRKYGIQFDRDSDGPRAGEDE